MGAGNRRRQAGERNTAHLAPEMVMPPPDAIRRRRHADREQKRGAPTDTPYTCTRLQKKRGAPTDTPYTCTRLQKPVEEIGRAHVGTPVTNAQLVCRLLLEQKKTIKSMKGRSRTHTQRTIR